MKVSADDYKLEHFETEIFKRPVWQLLNVSAAKEVTELAKSKDVQLINYRDSTDQIDTKKRTVLKESGFYEIETLITLEKELRGIAPETNLVCEASPADSAACAQIAAVCFKHDRYHTDENIENTIADAIKSHWVYNSVSDRADKVFIYKDNEQNILGFNACMYREEAAIIDLIGVHPEHQGKGIGRALLNAMVRHYAHKANVIRLGTQLSNEKSLTFYRAMGFVDRSTKTTWHWSN